MWWFIYVIVPALAGTPPALPRHSPGTPPAVHQLPETPAFHTEEQCTSWLVDEVRSGRLELAEDVLATCMSPPEPA